jgi:hypothetical protein
MFLEEANAGVHRRLLPLWVYFDVVEMSLGMYRAKKGFVGGIEVQT